VAKRLQVILQDPEYREIQRAARSRRMSIAEWVRQALAHARRRELLGDVDKKLAAIRAAAKYESPTADIETMLAEIEQGYLSGYEP
jgi:predicted 2-oxoglutarate/Fe(II)-dependent dioxygenase YbiX